MRTLLLLVLLLAVAMIHGAQAAATSGGATVDLSGVASMLIALVFSVLSIIVPVWVNNHIKDQAAKATIDAAVGHSLGALEQAATTGLASTNLKIPIPGVPATLQAGVQYVIDNAGPEMQRLGLTNEVIASKVDARLGLTKAAAKASSA
jgi:hypothetical protein